MSARQQGRHLGIDYGRARIGIAVSDALGLSVSPLGHIVRESDAAAARVCAALAEQEQVVAIVVGLPLHAHGDAGEAVGWVRAFVAALRQHSDLPIHECDERYTSAEAEEALRREGRWPASAGAIDAKAAAIVLRRFLDGEA